MQVRDLSILNNVFVNRIDFLTPVIGWCEPVIYEFIRGCIIKSEHLNQLFNSQVLTWKTKPIALI